MRLLHILVLASALLPASGLGAARQGPPDPVQSPRAEPPAAEPTAKLYVFNDSGRTLVPGNQELTDDGNRLASLPRQTYTAVSLRPGVHHLHPQYSRKPEVTITAEAGQTYYVVIAYKPTRSWAAPVAGSPVLLKELSEREAGELMKEMKPQ